MEDFVGILCPRCKGEGGKYLFKGNLWDLRREFIERPQYRGDDLPPYTPIYEWKDCSFCNGVCDVFIRERNAKSY